MFCSRFNVAKHNSSVLKERNILNAVINGSGRAMFWHSPSNLFRYLHGLHHHSYLSAIINEFVNVNEPCVMLFWEVKK